MTEESSWHAKEEYLSLRKEIETALADMAALERNCVVAVALAYGWLITEAKSVHGMHIAIGWALPVLLAVFGGLRMLSINSQLGLIGRYTRLIEIINKPAGSQYVGWEHFFDQHGRGTQTRVRLLFWVVLLVLTLVVWLVKLSDGF